MYIYKKMWMFFLVLFLSDGSLFGAPRRKTPQPSRPSTQSSQNQSSSVTSQNNSNSPSNIRNPHSDIPGDSANSQSNNNPPAVNPPASIRYSDYHSFDAIPRKCVVGSDGYIYLWIGNMWQKLDNQCLVTALAPLAIDSSGKFYIIGSDSNLWIGSYTSGSTSLSLGSTSYAINSTIKPIFVTVGANGDVWCIGSDYQPYKFDGSKFIGGYSVPSGVTGIRSIAITTTGVTFVIGMDNFVYKNKDGAWVRQDKMRSQVASDLKTDPNGNVWCIGLNDHQINWFLSSYTDDFYWGLGWGSYSKLAVGASCTWALSFPNDVSPKQEVLVNDSNPSGQDWHSAMPNKPSSTTSSAHFFAAESLVTLSGIPSGMALKHIIIQASAPTNKPANIPKI